MPENPLKSASGIELVGSPGALSASAFLVAERGSDPFAPELKRPTTVVSQSSTEIRLRVAWTPAEELETIVELTQPLSGSLTHSRPSASSIRNDIR